MAAYYNEFDKQAAAWLRNLISAGLIAPGDVDERSILDVTPDDLRGYTQCHFFAGIGVWSYALRGAGWSDDRPVWTGSCPCQPFSAAGGQLGFADERHLWPAFAWLIAECRPPVVFGEQVASGPVGPWVDLVHANLEAVDYAFGAVPFPSAGVGAPHIRDRLYWVGHTDDAGPQGHAWHDRAAGRTGPFGSAAEAGVPLRLAHPSRELDDWSGLIGASGGSEHTDGGSAVLVADAHGEREEPAGDAKGAGESGWCGEAKRLADDDRIGFVEAPVEGLRDQEHHAQSRGGPGRLADAQSSGRREECPDLGGQSVRDPAQGRSAGSEHGSGDLRPRPTNGFWGAADWLFCRDEKWRPVRPGTFPLVDGAPSRVVRLRAYGNAINAEQAKIFIQAFEEARLSGRPDLTGLDDLI